MLGMTSCPSRIAYINQLLVMMPHALPHRPQVNRMEGHVEENRAVAESSVREAQERAAELQRSLEAAEVQLDAARAELQAVRAHADEQRKAREAMQGEYHDSSMAVANSYVLPAQCFCWPVRLPPTHHVQRRVSFV